MRDTIQQYWLELADIARAMPYDGIAMAAELLFSCYQAGGTIFIVGNGGSAATASHFACDLAKGTQVPEATPFRVVALTDNVALITAWANDTGYERVFGEQLRPLGRAGDVLVAISASGNSPNILYAVEVARTLGMHIIALTGTTGGALAPAGDVAIQVPGGSIEQVEDAHTAIAHSLCVALRQHIQSEVAEWPTTDSFVRIERTEPVALQLGH